jgi:hypothetical protein
MFSGSRLFVAWLVTITRSQEEARVALGCSQLAPQNMDQ